MILQFLALLSLILQQGNPEYKKRELASAELKRVTACAKSTAAASPLLPFLVYGESHPDAEIAVRSKSILDGYYAKRAQTVSKTLKPKGWTKLPWIDGFPPDQQYRWEELGYYLNRARLIVPKEDQGWPDYPEYRLATELWLVDQLANRKTDAELLVLLEYMAKVEIYYKTHSRWPWNQD